MEITDFNFRYKHTKYGHGLQIWGPIEELREFHFLFADCWDTGENLMTPAENCAYKGVLAYFSYELRHAYMGVRLASLDGKEVKRWTGRTRTLFDDEPQRFEVGFELHWVHVFFILAAWGESLKHVDCTIPVMRAMRALTKGVEELLRERDEKGFSAIEPYLHGAIYSGNPYLMHFMDRAYNEYFFFANRGKVKLTKLAETLNLAVYGSMAYNMIMEMLEDSAKKYGCGIENLRTEIEEHRL